MKVRSAPPPARAAAPAKTWTAPKANANAEWVQDLRGNKSDPVNLYLHGDLKDIQKAFEKAGWVKPTPKSTGSMLEYGAAAVGEIGVRTANGWLGKAHLPKLPDPFKKTVEHMPIAHLFYKGKPDVLSFEKDNNPTGGRHHFRIFDTGQLDKNGEHVYAVAASLDIKTVIAPDRPEQMFITHVIDKNADKERNAVLQSLESVGAIASKSDVKLKFGEPAKTGLHSEDSRVWDVVLR